MKTLSENQNQYEEYRIRHLRRCELFQNCGGWEKSLWVAGFEKCIGQERQKLWRKDGCETGKKTKANWNPWGQTKSSKDEVELSRMRTDILTWKNEPACVFHHLQPHWCGRNLGNTSILCLWSWRCPGMWSRTCRIYRRRFSGSWNICELGCYSTLARW